VCSVIIEFFWFASRPAAFQTRPAAYIFKRFRVGGGFGVECTDNIFFFTTKFLKISKKSLLRKNRKIENFEKISSPKKSKKSKNHS